MQHVGMEESFTSLQRVVENEQHDWKLMDQQLRNPDLRVQTAADSMEASVNELQHGSAPETMAARCV